LVKLLSKRWWIHTGTRLEGPKLEPEGQRAEVGFPTADLGFSSIQGTLFGFCGIKVVFDDCNIYPHQAWTNANDKMTVKDYIFAKHHAQRKILKHKPRRNGKRCKRCRISIVRHRICC